MHCAEWRKPLTIWLHLYNILKMITLQRWKIDEGLPGVKDGVEEEGGRSDSKGAAGGGICAAGITIVVVVKHL